MWGCDLITWFVKRNNVLIYTQQQFFLFGNWCRNCDLVEIYWKLYDFRWFPDLAAPPPGHHFDVILILLPTSWFFFSYMLFWLPRFLIVFYIIAISGLLLGSIWHAFWNAWEPWKWSQNPDGSTILTLRNSIFQARFLGLNLLPICVQDLLHFYAFLGSLWEAFWFAFARK